MSYIFQVMDNGYCVACKRHSFMIYSMRLVWKSECIQPMEMGRYLLSTDFVFSVRPKLEIITTDMVM